MVYKYSSIDMVMTIRVLIVVITNTFYKAYIIDM